MITVIFFIVYYLLIVSIVSDNDQNVTLFDRNFVFHNIQYSSFLTVICLMSLITMLYLSIIKCTSSTVVVVLLYPLSLDSSKTLCTSFVTVHTIRIVLISPSSSISAPRVVVIIISITAFQASYVTNKTKTYHYLIAV